MQENVPSKAGLLELLRTSDGVQFVIPAYQRNYIWTANKEVKQLLEDVKAVLTGKRKKHFVGIIIYLEKSLSAFSRERLIIDGQQRLTTIFLTLYAIKELMIEYQKKEDAEMLEEMYLLNRFSKTNRYKLKPLVSDDTVYQQIVNGDFDMIENKDSKVYLNFIYIKKSIGTFLKDFSFEDILDGLNKMYIVVIPITESDYPQKVFESINATGAKLTASDLIRNFILMPIESELQDEYYDKYWKRIELLIANDSKKLEAFFRFFLMAKLQTMINKSFVYYTFTEWFEANVEEMRVEGVFKEILEYAESYYRIYRASSAELDDVLRPSVEEFRQILSDMPAPLLLEFFQLFKHGKISAQQLSEIIIVLNSYLMRRQLCDIDTSGISNFFPQLLKETIADCSEDYSNIVEVFKKNLVNRNKGNSHSMPDNKIMYDRIANANMYNLRFWLMVFFRKLEQENNPAVIDFSHLSIEHLMPQTPTTEWLYTLGCDKETYERNVHRLGNLTVAAKSDNSKMGNKVWDYKNKILRSTSHIRINASILDKPQWTLQDVEDRTKLLIREMIRLYPYYEASRTTIEKVPISISHQLGKANAYFYPDNNSVEILEGSVLSYVGEPYGEIEDIFNKLIEDEIIGELDGKLVFYDNFIVYPKRANATALSMSAAIILNVSCNGKNLWRTEDGTLMNDVLHNKEQSLFDDVLYETKNANDNNLKQVNNFIESSKILSLNESLFGGPIQVVDGMIVIPTAPASGQKREGLYIKIVYPDGRIDYNKKVWQLFVDCIKWIGPERVQSLNIWIRNAPITSKVLSENSVIRRTQRYLESGYYVCTYSKTLEKYRCLEYINRVLDLGMKISLIEK